MADKSLKELVKQAIEDLIVDGEIVIEDTEGNKIEDLCVSVVNNEEDFDDEDSEETEEDEGEDEEDK